MGMRVHGNTSASGSGAISDWQQRQQNVKSIMTAIQSGDLTSAQKAYATLQTGLGGQSNAAGGDSGPFAAIGKALQSGDIQAAQQAAADFQAKRAGHHHGHGGSATASGTTAASGIGPLADSGAGSNIHYVA